MIILLLGAFVAIAFVFSRRESEPSYEGKPLSDWVVLHNPRRGELVSDTETNKAAAAIRAIGTNSLPLLITWIRYESPSHSRRVLDPLMHRLPQFLVPRSYWRKADPVLAEDAAVAFAALGPSAAAAIPELAAIPITTTNWESACRAMDALSRIGPLSIPALINIATNSKARCRYVAILALGDFGTNAALAQPVLLRMLSETNTVLVLPLTKALGKIRLQPNLSLPVLTNVLQHRSRLNRAAALEAIQGFGADVRMVLPAITNALTDTNDSVRNRAAQILDSIAPEFLTNAPAP
jgi:hypothetical protein